MLPVMSTMKAIMTLKLHSLYLVAMNKITLYIHVKSNLRLSLNSLLRKSNHMVSVRSINYDNYYES